MANVQIKDGAEAEKYLKSTGAGSDGDAYIPQHLETNSGDIKTAVELLDNAISGARMLVTEDNSGDIKTAVELLDNAISGARMLVTEDNSAAIKTAVELLDNAISGSRMLVTEDNSGDIKTAVELLDNAISGTALRTKDNGPETGAAIVGGTAVPTFTESDAMHSGAVNIGPAPSGGEKSVLLQITVSTDTAILFTMQAATPAAERHAFYLPANGTVVFVPRYPIKLSVADKQWQGIASGAANIRVTTVTTSEA